MFKIPLLVISTDSYSDTWNIFFEMFSRNFPEFDGPKFLATETLDFNYNGVKVINTAKNKTNPSWGESLVVSLNYIGSSDIFLILDDFILISKVDSVKMLEAYNFFKKLECDFLTLATHDSKRNGNKLDNLNPFIRVNKYTKYRVTTTPSFWNVEVLKSYLSTEINPWQFEILGSIKSFFRSDNFFMLNPNLFSIKNELFPYYFSNNLDTAIVRGKWQIDACEKFPDFKEVILKRGLIDTSIPHRPKTFKKVFSSPLVVIGYFLGLKLKR